MHSTIRFKKINKQKQINKLQSQKCKFKERKYNCHEIKFWLSINAMNETMITRDLKKNVKKNYI